MSCNTSDCASPRNLGPSFPDHRCRGSTVSGTVSGLYNTVDLLGANSSSGPITVCFTLVFNVQLMVVDRDQRPRLGHKMRDGRRLCKRQKGIESRMKAASLRLAGLQGQGGPDGIRHKAWAQAAGPEADCGQGHWHDQGGG